MAGPSEATEKWGGQNPKVWVKNQISAEICLLLTNFALSLWKVGEGWAIAPLSPCSQRPWYILNILLDTVRHLVANSCIKLNFRFFSLQQQTEQQNMDVEGSGHDMQSRAISTFHDSQSYLMRDWVLVAAGLERLFFTIYAMAFGVITAVYVWNYILIKKPNLWVYN